MGIIWINFPFQFSQVLLGRSTEDVKVDIDLGREGRANKISRRQVKKTRPNFFVMHVTSFSVSL